MFETIDEILFTAGSVDIQAAGQTHPQVSILAYSDSLTIPVMFCQLVTVPDN